MLSSLLRPKKGRRREEQHSPFSSQFDQSSPVTERSRLFPRHATADFTETENEDENSDEDEDPHHRHDDDDGDDDEEQREDGDGEPDEDDDEDENEDGDEDTPLLPIFSAAHLGMGASISTSFSSSSCTS